MRIHGLFFYFFSVSAASSWHWSSTSLFCSSFWRFMACFSNCWVGTEVFISSPNWLQTKFSSLSDTTVKTHNAGHCNYRKAWDTHGFKSMSGASPVSCSQEEEAPSSPEVHKHPLSTPMSRRLHQRYASTWPLLTSTVSRVDTGQVQHLIQPCMHTRPERQSSSKSNTLR